MTKRILLSLILWGGVVFNTLNAQKTLPYSYGFEFTHSGTINKTLSDAALSAEGWTTTNASSASNYTSIYNWPNYSGNKMFRFAVDESIDYQYLMTPLLENASCLIVDLYVRVSNSSSLKYQIGYTKSNEPDITSNFTWNDPKTVTSTAYTLASESFFTDGIKYIAIKFDRNSDSSNTHFLAIDDITISIVPPSNNKVSPMTTLATLSWTKGYNESNWLLYYSTTNTAPTDYTTNVIPVNTNPTYTITGLTKDETYYAWVCSKENEIYSAWIGPVEFTPADEFTLTVNNGTYTNSNAPLYGSGAANGTKSQFMVPATMLSNMANTQITKLDFYGAAANTNFGSAEYNIYMAETTASKFETASFENWESMSLVYNGSLSTDGNKMMTIDLTTPYIYSGGNLIIGCCSSAYGTNSYISWYGVNNSNDANLTLSCTANSSHVYSTESYVAFSPKVTFTYQNITFDNHNWGTGATPTTAQNVEVKNNVTVADGTNALANIIEMASGSTLTIENGATLTCNNIIGATTANLVIKDGGQLICNNTVAATVKKSIEGATSKDVYGWYTISSPVDDIEISSMTELLANEYDLYRYNEASMMWENYKAHNSGPEADFTNMTNGRGYLYRNAQDVELQFTGSTNVGDVVYPLSYTDESGDLCGFHLIGNPYTHSIAKGEGKAIYNAALASGYYSLNVAQDAWLACEDGNEIEAMQGILVQTTDALADFTIQDINYAPAKANHDNIMFTVGNSEYSDITYAMFDKGHGLNKISHRNADVPMLYIPQNGENFAIAMMDDNTKSFELNFKAMTTGKYTLSCKTKGNYSYLHVIDRLTGEDVDMLLEDEYSFVASKNDNANRFIVKLKYSENPAGSESSTFAWQNGSDIIVYGEGELQIFDVMGRRVSTMRVSGETTITAPSMQGVYIFKLNDKTQKIVVK